MKPFELVRPYIWVGAIHFIRWFTTVIVVALGLTLFDTCCFWAFGYQWGYTDYEAELVFRYGGGKLPVAVGRLIRAMLGTVLIHAYLGLPKQWWLCLPLLALEILVLYVGLRFLSVINILIFW